MTFDIQELQVLIGIGVILLQAYNTTQHWKTRSMILELKLYMHQNFIEKPHRPRREAEGSLGK